MLKLPQLLLERVSAAVDVLLLRQEILQRKVDEMAKTLDDVLAVVTPLGDKIDSLVALVNGIEQQLKDALSGVTLPPGVQTKVDAVFDQITAESAKVQAALDANTPPVPTP